jgi:predicted NBD/HSP70 family sugar kinase
VAGDVIASAVALIDGLVVLGGGISAASPPFLPALFGDLNGTLDRADGILVARVAFPSSISTALTAWRSSSPTRARSCRCAEPTVAFATSPESAAASPSRASAPARPSSPVPPPSRSSASPSGKAGEDSALTPQVSKPHLV